MNNKLLVGFLGAPDAVRRVLILILAWVSDSRAVSQQTPSTAS